MGGAGDDIVDGGQDDDRLTGGSGNDVLTGGQGNDTLFGGDGTDELQGGDGSDQLDGGTGNDTLFGGAGDDVYVVDNAADVVTENANEGVDTVQASVSRALSANVEHLTLTGTADIDGSGNELANTLVGNAGINLLSGGAGNDTKWRIAA